jgi:DNA-directed RNA polymerase subunit D
MELVMGRIDDTSGRFILSGCTPAFANSFRREMIGGVAKLAIEDVKIYDNTSALFDEMLAHRLGLIPLRTERSVRSGIMPSRWASISSMRAEVLS